MKPIFKVLIAIGVFAVLLLTLILVQGYIARQEAEEENATPTPTASNEIQLTADLPPVRIVLNNNNGTLEFEKKDDTWSMPGHDNVRVLESEIDSMASSLWGMVSSDVIGDASGLSLSEFGLDPPECTVTVAHEDGQVEVLLIGIKSPAVSARYAMTEGSDKIVMINNYTAERFLKSYEDFRDRSLPSVNTEIVEKLIAKSETENIRLYAKDVDQTVANYGLTYLTMESPYPGREVYSTRLEDFYKAVAALTIETFVEDNAGDLGQYGLDEPVMDLKIEDAEDGVLHLRFGSDAPDGGIYFMQVGEPHVYAMTKSIAEPIIKITGFDIADHFIAMYNISDVESIGIQDGDTAWKLEIKREQSGEDVKETYFLNGAEKEEKPYKELYRNIIGIMADATVEGFEPDGADIMTIEFKFHTGAPPATMRMFVYDNNFLAVEHDGVIQFLSSRRYVEVLRQSLESLNS